MSQNAPFGPVSNKSPDKVGDTTRVGVHPVKHTDGKDNLRVGKPTVHRAGK